MRNFFGALPLKTSRNGTKLDVLHLVKHIYLAKYRRSVYPRKFSLRRQGRTRTDVQYTLESSHYVAEEEPHRLRLLMRNFLGTLPLRTSRSGLGLEKTSPRTDAQYILRSSHCVASLSNSDHKASIRATAARVFS